RGGADADRPLPRPPVLGLPIRFAGERTTPGLPRPPFLYLPIRALFALVFLAGWLAALDSCPPWLFPPENDTDRATGQLIQCEADRHGLHKDENLSTSLTKKNPFTSPKFRYPLLLGAISCGLVLWLVGTISSYAMSPKHPLGWLVRVLAPSRPVLWLVRWLG